MQPREMEFERWALPRLQALLPLDEGELRQIVQYTSNLSDSDAAKHLQGLLGDSPQALDFIASFAQHRAELQAGVASPWGDSKDAKTSTDNAGSPLAGSTGRDPEKHKVDVAPPPGPPPSYYGTQSGPLAPARGAGSFAHHHHTNQVLEAGKLRARDEVSDSSLPKRQGVAAA